MFSSRLYRDLVIRQRAIIPLSGFFEWKKNGDRNRPFKIHLQDDPIMSVAGIWNTWRARTADERQSFSIMTTAANEFMRGIHDRMPVILGRSDEDPWLDPEIQEKDAIHELMKPCPSEWLAAVEVSTLVNSTRNNTAEVLKTVGASEKGQLRGLFDD